MARAPHNIMVAVLAVVILGACAQRRPPNYSLDDMPQTSFDCRDKTIGGYFADPEADCQMFHVCVKMSENDIQDFRFLCPNDTMFDQENQICANWFDIDCEANSLYYSKGFDLLRLGKGVASEDLLQKSTALEHRLPTVVVPRPDPGRHRLGHRDEQDLFRGSSSGDIHRGRDEEDEEFERQNKKKTKVVTRRKQQNRGRRPVITTTFKPDEITTILPEEFRTDQQQASTPEYTNIIRNRNTEKTRGTPIPLAPTFHDQPKSTFQSTSKAAFTQQQATSPQPSQQRNFQINVQPSNNFQRTQQRNNFQGNDFQRTQPRQNSQTPAPSAPAPFSGESQRSQPRNFQTGPSRQNNDLQRGNQRFNNENSNNNNNNGGFQQPQQPQQNAAPQGDFQRTRPRNNFQNQSPRAQQRNQEQRNQAPSSFVTAPPSAQGASSTFQASTAAPISRTTFQPFPSSTFAPPPSRDQSNGFSSLAPFVSSTIAPTTFHRNLNEDQHLTPSTISPTTYNAFQQRKNLQRNKFPSTPTPQASFNNNNQRQFQSSPVPTFQQTVSTFAPAFSAEASTARPVQQFAPTTYRPRPPQSNVPQPFQQRRVSRPRDDFVSNEHPDEILNTAHSSSFRASDLNSIQKSKSTFAPPTSSPFPAPSSPRSFTQRQNNQQNRQHASAPTTPAPQHFDRSTPQDNRRPVSQNQPTQFFNSPSTAQFVNPSTAKPVFTGTHHFNPSTPEPFNAPQQQNFFNPSSAKPQPSSQRFNNNNNNNNSPSTPQPNFNTSPQQRFNPSSPQSFNSQPQQTFFNPSTAKPNSVSPAENVFFTTPSSRPSPTFFNPSTAQPNSPTFFNAPSNSPSSTPKPFTAQRASSPRGFASPSTAQPFQSRPAASPAGEEKKTTGKPHKKANKDYDYAYYDDTPFDEYEGVEHISEFTKTKN